MALEELFVDGDVLDRDQPRPGSCSAIASTRKRRVCGDRRDRGARARSDTRRLTSRRWEWRGRARRRRLARPGGADAAAGAGARLAAGGAAGARSSAIVDDVRRIRSMRRIGPHQAAVRPLKTMCRPLLLGDLLQHRLELRAGIRPAAAAAALCTSCCASSVKPLDVLVAAARCPPAAAPGRVAHARCRLLRASAARPAAPCSSRSSSVCLFCFSAWTRLSALPSADSRAHRCDD